MKTKGKKLLELARKVDVMFEASNLEDYEKMAILSFLAAKVIYALGVVTQKDLDYAINAVSEDIKMHFKHISEILSVNQEIAN